MDKRLKFNEPWILQRADPYVYEKDGWYYFTASVPACTTLPTLIFFPPILN